MNMIRQISPVRKELLPENLLPFLDAHYTLKPFDPLTLEFLHAISRFLLSDQKLNKLPAFAALGFWLRRANMNRIMKENRHLTDPSGYRIEPLGIVFHVCPSNVDTMFIYSLAISLLMGNKNIVKISDRLRNEIIEYFTDGINNILKSEEYKLFNQYVAFISYEHNDEISGYFSLNADARILWGGDHTIAKFKSFPTKPRIKDLAFADRISAAIFKSASFMRLPDEERKESARKFYNDTFTFDQLGCSSPQMIFCLGSAIDNAAFLKEIYDLLHDFAARLYVQDMYSVANLKLNFLAENALDDRLLNVIYSSNYLVFAEVADNLNDISKSCGAGFFFIKQLDHPGRIGDFITRKIQTLSYFGLDPTELDQIAAVSYSKGIDRIVPVGDALNFDYIWDGYHLPDELSSKKRIISTS
jgi:hypothetical protein